MDSARGFFILLLVACCLLDLAFCQPAMPPPASPAASPPAASDFVSPLLPLTESSPGNPGAPPPSGSAAPDVPPPPTPPAMPVPSPGGIRYPPSPPSPSPPSPSPLSPSPPSPPTPPPPTPEEPGTTWNASEKAGVVIASIAALLQVAVVAFLFIKRHQMLTTVDYDDIDDLESDDIRHNANYRHADSA